jgi:hypothetical protein
MCTYKVVREAHFRISFPYGISSTSNEIQVLAANLTKVSITKMMPLAVKMDTLNNDEGAELL